MSRAPIRVCRAGHHRREGEIIVGHLPRAAQPGSRGWARLRGNWQLGARALCGQADEAHARVVPAGRVLLLPLEELFLGERLLEREVFDAEPPVVCDVELPKLLDEWPDERHVDGLESRSDEHPDRPSTTETRAR